MGYYIYENYYAFLLIIIFITYEYYVYVLV